MALTQHKDTAMFAFLPRITCALLFSPQWYHRHQVDQYLHEVCHSCQWKSPALNENEQSRMAWVVVCLNVSLNTEQFYPIFNFTTLLHVQIKNCSNKCKTLCLGYRYDIISIYIYLHTNTFHCLFSCHLQDRSLLIIGKSTKPSVVGRTNGYRSMSSKDSSTGLISLSPYTTRFAIQLPASGFIKGLCCGFCFNREP